MLANVLRKKRNTRATFVVKHDYQKEKEVLIYTINTT